MMIILEIFFCKRKIVYSKLLYIEIELPVAQFAPQTQNKFCGYLHFRLQFRHCRLRTENTHHALALFVNAVNGKHALIERLLQNLP